MTARNVAPEVLKSRLLADLVQAMSAGHVLQASAVAVLVGRNAYDLVQQALAGKPHGDADVDQHLQMHLRNVVTVVSTAERHFRSVLLAVHWYRTGGPGTAEGQAPEALTAAGRVEAACRLLTQPAGG